MKAVSIMNQLCHDETECSKEMNSMYRSMVNERLQAYGSEALMPEELIMTLTGMPLHTAKHIIQAHGLREAINFVETFKLTPAQKKKLQLLYTFNKALNVSDFKEREVLNTTNKAGLYFLNQLQFLRHEVFAIALLDSQNRLICFVKAFEGTLNECAVYIRQIVRLVVENNANSVIIGHNHPAGSTNPSSADIQVCMRIKEALKTISVSLNDSIIVAQDKFISFAERGLL